MKKDKPVDDSGKEITKHDRMTRPRSLRAHPVRQIMTFDELVFFTFNMELLANGSTYNSFLTGLSIDDKDGRAKKAEELILEMAERIKNDQANGRN